MDADTQLRHIPLPAPSTVQSLTTPASMARSAVALLDLPAEIRNMIYRHLFPKGRSAVQLLKRHNGKSFIAMSDRLDIIVTCRQIYKETTSVLHEQHRLVVVQPKTLQQLLMQLWVEDEVSYDSEIEDEFFPNHILKYLDPQGGVSLDYDLDDSTLITNAPMLMYTNQWLRGVCMSYSTLAQITATMTSTSGKSTFRGFQALQAWIKDGHADPNRWDEPDGHETTIILSFDIKINCSLTDIQFDATAFLRATRRLRSPDMVHVQIEPCGVSGVISNIQVNVLVFMWNLIREYPETRTGPCPTIWINGMYWPQSAEFTDEHGGVTVVSDQGMTKSETNVCLGAQAARVVEALVHMGDPDYSGPEEESGSEFDATFPLEMNFDQGSLLGVATDLARLMHRKGEMLW